MTVENIGNPPKISINVDLLKAASDGKKNVPDDFEPIKCAKKHMETEMKYARADDSHFKVHEGVLKTHVKLTSIDSDTRTYSFTFEADCETLSFLPGDSISIFCENLDSEVDALLSRILDDRIDDSLLLNVSVDELSKRKIPLHIPQPTSRLFHVFKYCLDIRAPMKKPLIRSLIEYTSSDYEIEQLITLFRMSSIEFVRYNRHMSIIDILEKFKSCKPSLEVLLTHLPRLEPRCYSIVVEQSDVKRQFEVAFTVVDKKKAGRDGLCSTWLEAMLRSDKERSIRFFRNKQTKFVFPPPTVEMSKVDHVILIAAGTGISPSIGFLRHVKRHHVQSAKFHLYFGCRHPCQDFIFKNEIMEFLKDEILQKVYLSFSRISNDDVDLYELLGERSSNISARVGYVQDHFSESRIAKLLDTDASSVVYVCGDAKGMANDVKASLVSCLDDANTAERSKNGRDIIDEMVKKSMYLEDIWL